MPLSTHLQDGRVLIVGGDNGFGSPLDSAEIYDPATRTFTATGPPMHSHFLGGITAINPPGKGSQAIVYGGFFASDAASWELWDSTAGTNGSFTSAGSMPTGQASFPTAVPLADGRFVIIGGEDTQAEPLSTEQLLMPGTQTFSLGLPLNQARDSHTLTALTSPPGLLVTGGVNSSGALATAEVRGPSGWTVLSGTGPCPGSAGCMTATRYSHTATLLPDGRVVIAGGSGGNGALGATEFYDPASQTFQVGPLMRPAAGHTATAFSLTDVPSTLTLISDVNPSAFGEQVTFTATVSPSAASGQVTFSEGSNTLKSAPLSNGQATFQTSALAPGPHTITATYGGDKTFLGSSGSVVQSVSQLLSGTTLSGPTSAAAGQKVTYTASVSPNNAAGQVAFYDQGAQLAIVNLAPNNQAVYSSTSFTLGLHSITAKYLGNADYQPSSSGAVQLNVSQATSTTKLASTPNPSTYQQPITLTATVTSTFGTPVGQVSFLDGSTTIGSAALSGGSATLTVANLSGGSHVLTAAYQGSANVAASTSPSITQTVKPAATSTAVASSLNPSTFGQSVTFTATVLPTSGKGTPTGTVAFKDGNATLGTVPLNSGAATFSTAALSGGSHTITAAYAGDGNYAASTSAPIPQTVNRAVANVAVFSTLNPSFYGQSVTLTAQVSASAGGPTGAVTFKDGTATLGTASLSSGQASINTPALTGGIHTITAVYGGDTNFLISTSSPLTQVVNKSGTSTAVISSLNPSNTGQPVIFTATVTPQSGTNPTGIVTFTDGTTVLGTPSLSGGVAALTTSSLAAGTHVIVATYGGDRNYTGSSSQGLAQNVISTMMTPVFSNLTPSQTVPLGTAHIDLSGTISAPGPAYPPANENVSVTIGGISRQVNIGGKGAFSFNNFPTNTLAGGMYNITYSYAGDAAFNAAMNSTTTLTVGGGSPLPTTTTLTPSVQACITGQDFILTISVAVVPPASPPDGQVVLTRKNPDGTITSLGQQYLVGGVWAPAFNGMATGRYTFFGHYQGTAQFQASDGQADLTCNEP
jgi:hypothetical protein